MADRPNILVVGDNKGERTAIATALRDAGFSVVAAACERAPRTLPTLAHYAAAVIALPEDDGVEIRRQLRQRHPGLAAREADSCQI